MTELIESTERSPDSAAYAASLLHHYGFDLGGDAIEPLLLAWQEQYPAFWIRLATIEALYQGRYKAISVEQILALWQRRSQPLYHFNHEFERLICDRLPQTFALPVPLRQEEQFSMRSAPAMVAKLQPYQAAPSHEATSALHSLHAMQALRTLHNDAMADLTPVNRPAESSAASIEPSLMQTDTYTLRSEARLLQPSTYEQHERLTQSNLDLILPSNSAASLAAISNEGLKAGLIAATNARSGNEQPPASLSASGLASSSPTNNGQPSQPTTAQAASIARILQQLDDQGSAQTLFPGVGLLAQTLKPKPRLHFTASYQPIWLTNLSNQPIHQFTPAPETSDFHHKLKAVAQWPDGLPDQKSDVPSNA